MLERRESHMTRQPLLLVAMLVSGLLLAAAPARAETVETRQAGEVYAAPGESSRVVTRVRAGDAMTVLARSGRWLKVRVNGRTGWVTRSVVASETREDVRTTRRRPFVEGRSTRRSVRGAAPSDRVGAD